MKNFTFKIKKQKIIHELEYIKDLPASFNFTGKLVTRLGSTHITQLISSGDYEYPYMFKDLKDSDGFCPGVINASHLREKNFYLLVKP